MRLIGVDSSAVPSRNDVDVDVEGGVWREKRMSKVSSPRIGQAVGSSDGRKDRLSLRLLWEEDGEWEDE